MRRRKHYEQPTAEVVELPVKNQLLAGSEFTAGFYGNLEEEDILPSIGGGGFGGNLSEEDLD